MDWKFSLALRHLSGAKSRKAVRWMNVFAFVGLGLSVFAWLTITSVMTGMQNQIKDRVLEFKPHVIWEERPRANAEATEKQLRDLVPGLKSLELTLRSEALVEFTVTQSGRSRQSGGVVEGSSQLKKVDEDNQLVNIPASLAQRLTVLEGDVIKLRSAWNLKGFPLSLRVNEIYPDDTSGDIVAPIMLSREVLSDWLELDNSFSWIAIRLEEPSKAGEVAQLLNSSLEMNFKSWEDVDSALWYSLRLEKTVMSLAVVFVLILSSFALYMAISVRLAEKLKELALLRALGARATDLRKLFLIQGVVIGIVGGLAGVIGSFLVCYALENVVSLPSFYYSTNVPVAWEWTRVAFSLLVVLALSYFSTLFPIQRALNFSISETLRS